MTRKRSHLWMRRSNRAIEWWACLKCDATAIDTAERDEHDKAGCKRVDHRSWH